MTSFLVARHVAKRSWKYGSMFERFSRQFQDARIDHALMTLNNASAGQAGVKTSRWSVTHRFGQISNPVYSVLASLFLLLPDTTTAPKFGIGLHGCFATATELANRFAVDSLPITPIRVSELETHSHVPGDFSWIKVVSKVFLLMRRNLAKTQGEFDFKPIFED